MRVSVKKDKQPQHILKEMKIKEKLIRAIYRSELAYTNYSNQKFFFQAFRIYKANLSVYLLLENYLLECPNEIQEDVCAYLFHLEVWINQFEYHQKNIQPTDFFVFERWEGGIAFPKEFVEFLKNNI